MNIALSSLLLILIIAPGYIGLAKYYTSGEKYDIDIINIEDNFFRFSYKGILFTILSYLTIYFFIFLLRLFWSNIQYPDLEIIFIVLLNNFQKESAYTPKMIGTIFQKDILNITLFYVATLFISGSWGQFIRYFVRSRMLDLKFNTLSFDYWFYFFTGEKYFLNLENKIKEILEQAKEITISNETKKKLDYLQDIIKNKKYTFFSSIGLTVFLDNKTYVYVGRYAGHTVKNGELTEICIKNPYRRKIEDDNKRNGSSPQKDNDVYYKVAANYLRIPFKSVITYSVKYICSRVKLTSNTPLTSE